MSISRQKPGSLLVPVADAFFGSSGVLALLRKSLPLLAV
jgi:hypothetical protein